MMEHLIEHLFRKIESIFSFGSNLIGPFVTVILGIVLMGAGIIILPFFIIILMGFLGIYTIFTTHNILLRVMLILFVFLPYGGIFFKIYFTNNKTDKVKDPL